tara:strand:- start:211 stop:342 length:132 start_codon:yes stop_codon:yes gene_type:complete
MQRPLQKESISFNSNRCTSADIHQQMKDPLLMISYLFYFLLID